MEISVADLARLVDGIVVGNSNTTLRAVSKIEEATEGSLAFLANPDYEPFIYETQASAVLVQQDFSPRENLPKSLTLIRVEDPYSAFARILNWAQKEKKHPAGIHASSVVSTNSEIGEGCYIGPLVIIEDGAKIGSHCQIHGRVFIGKNCSIGDHCIIHPNVTIMHESVLGNECIIQPGAIIGSDGFGFAPNGNNDYLKVPQIGNVRIGNRCEIGAATTIDRATMGSTVIEDGVKLDNQIQVAHNVSIGQNTVIAAQTGIAGSTSIGENCMIGGQVGFAGHITIASGVKIAAQSGVTKSIQEADSVWQGTPALPIKDYQSQQITLRKLIRSLVLQRLEQLEKQSNVSK